MNICFWKPKFRINAMPGPSGSWYWKLISNGNNETLAVSETYSGRTACLQTAMKVAKVLKCPLRELVDDGVGPSYWITHNI